MRSREARLGRGAGADWIRLAIIGTASAMLSCSLDKNSPDFPGNDSNNTFQASGVSRWSVSDAQTGERIATGCGSEEVVSGIAPGRQLVVEQWSERASVASTDGLRILEGFWCSDHPRIHRQPTSFVDSLDCWRAPEEGPYGSAARVLEMEVLPAESEPTADASTFGPNLVPGRGYRFTIEVLKAGRAFLVSSGICDKTDESGHVQPKSGKSIVVIEAEP